LKLRAINSKLKGIVTKKSKPEKKEKRAKKPKDAPKKPMSAFFCY
jgi:hypothetical protein